MKKNNFVEGAFIASVAIILTKIIGLLYVIPFYAVLNSTGDNTGGSLYGYAYNIYNLFLILSTSGIPLAVSKITSEYNTLGQHNEKKYLYSIANKIILIFSLFSFLICFIFAKPIANLIIGKLIGGNSIEDVTYVIRCVSFALLVVPSLSIMRGYLQGHKYITAPSISQVIEQFFRVLVIILGSYISIKVFHTTVTTAVGVAVFGACAGATISYIYLLIKSRVVVNQVKKVVLSLAEKRNVLKKFLSYVIPFIFITISGSLYNSTDMILLIRGLSKIGMAASDIENISAVFTTWGYKLVSIVTAIATGIIISLIPSLVSAYVKKEEKETNMIFNKALKILFFVILPISIFASLFANEIWVIFYGKDFYGPIIMKFLFIVAFFDASFMMICSALQGLNKTKVIYIVVLLGLGLNAALDIPLIFLFNKVGIYPFYGTIAATLVGYSSSLIFSLIYLHKKDNINFNDTFKLMPKVFIKMFLCLAITVPFKFIFNNISGRLITLIVFGITGVVYVTIYYLINKDTMRDILGDRFLKKLFRK